ncbi:hypothetical protein FM076_14725 [Streptomyces albus subsp. chlorinus]|uniref:hypothetical protein n=1 Tax=Streptomyces albus TaxID=1888 RepID=UPI00156F35BA|nr:hypothetical protein [Streptomyces albus]NSC22371.1 hypothetical protein [Streptomyces albus subsp. chlorinus]
MKPFPRRSPRGNRTARTPRAPRPAAPRSAAALAAALATTLATTLAAVLTGAPAAPAAPVRTAVPDPETREAAGLALPVQRRSAPLRAVSATRFDLRAGEKLALDTPALRFAVGAWGTGRPTNIGTTLALICTGPDGRQALRAHDGANLTPKEPHRNPVIRALLTARADGTYTCGLSASAHSTATARGMTVRLEGERSVNGTRVSGDSTTWARPTADGDLLLAPGTTAEPMNTRTRVGAVGALGYASLRITVDAEATTCNRAGAYGRLCRPRNPRASGSVLTSWVEVRERNAAGKAVGPLHKSPAMTRSVSAGQHHTMLHHTLEVTTSREAWGDLPPGGQGRVDIRLKVRVDSGDHMVFHAGYDHGRGVAVKSPVLLPSLGGPLEGLHTALGSLGELEPLRALGARHARSERPSPGELRALRHLRALVPSWPHRAPAGTS